VLQNEKPPTETDISLENNQSFLYCFIHSYEEEDFAQTARSVVRKHIPFWCLELARVE